MPSHKRNHYVPQWYQRRFLPKELKEKKFCYLNLNPKTIAKGSRYYTEKAIRFFGTNNCFCQDDLYATRFRNLESTEIEQKFFGKIDNDGLAAVEYFSTFKHPSVSSVSKKLLNDLLLYMSTQKLRTPKGLTNLAQLIRNNDNNAILYALQKFQNLFCALWVECIWCIADASQSETKFIISDHPVTVYNKGCFPMSQKCHNGGDPEIWLSGTHTLFPLDLNKILILTNLSWIRNPYGNPLKERPNSSPFRNTIFDFHSMQTNRMLTDIEVNEINFIIKKRAHRYIASTNKDWLYPENKISTEYWNKLGKGYLLMPDPRSVVFSSGLCIGYKDGRAEGFDEYGRKPPCQFAYQSQRDKEWETFQAFQGEFAKIFGPKRRGLSYEGCRLDHTEDSPEYHAYFIGLNKKYNSKKKELVY